MVACTYRASYLLNPHQGWRSMLRKRRLLPTWVIRLLASATQSVGSLMSPEMLELANGIAFWRNHPRWPADFHNAEYEALARRNPNGNFTLDWWRSFLPTLQAWVTASPAVAPRARRRENWGRLLADVGPL
jgi:hypothetical protein